MSSYQATALNPRNQAIETVQMLDNYFAHHQYAVAFQDGSKYPENQVVCIHPNDVTNENHMKVFYQNYCAIIHRVVGWHGCLYVNTEEYDFEGRTLDIACVEFKHTVDRYLSNLRRNK